MRSFVMPRGGRPSVLRALEAGLPEKILRDHWNHLRFGANAPLSDMAIYPRPRDVLSYRGRGRRLRFRRRQSGLVRGGAWDMERGPLERDVKFQSCWMRWVEGADWPETPIYQRLLREISEGHTPDGCADPEAVVARYRRLDQIFDEARARGRLRPMEDLPDYFRRAHGAPLVHVARDGICLRAGGGAHRFAIAWILDLPEIQAQVGVIHPEAVRSGHLARLSVPKADAGRALMAPRAL